MYKPSGPTLVERAGKIKVFVCYGGANMKHTMEQRPMERMTRVTAASHEVMFLEACFEAYLNAQLIEKCKKQFFS